MAFVFRSPKRSIFGQQSTNDTPEPEPEQPHLNAQHQLNNPKRTFSLSKICKGFSINSQAYNKLIPKQQHKPSILPMPEGNTIHQHRNINSSKPFFYLNRAHNNTLPKQTKQSSSKIQLQNILSIKETCNYDNNLMDFKILKQSCKKYRQPLYQQKEIKQTHNNQNEKPQFKYLNKNLLKTINILTSKQKNQFETNKLSFLFKQQNEKLPYNRTKNFNFNSLKKLSPIKWQLPKKSEEEKQNLLTLLSTNYKPQSLQKQSLKQRKIKNKLITKLQPNLKQTQKEEEQEQSQEQYDVSATPGPGSYSIENWDTKKQFRSKKQKFRKMFYSPLERFEKSNHSQEITAIQDLYSSSLNNNEPKTNICSSFLSKSPRFVEKQQNYSPPPGYYDTRQTLEHDLMRNILKSSNSTVFINCDSPLPRKKQIIYSPGPGSYHVDSILQKMNEEHGQTSYIYKSKINRNIQVIDKQQERVEINQLIKKKNKENISPIHVQQPSFYSNYVNDVPPFLSTSQRFPQYQKSLNTSLFNPKLCQRQQKIPNYKQGFNSSSRRDMQIKAQPGVSIGLYDITVNQNWNKKSFNILFT